MNNTVTLQKHIPRPEDWRPVGGHYYSNKNGRRIHEECYDAKIEERNTLAEYITEVDPYNE